MLSMQAQLDLSVIPQSDQTATVRSLGQYPTPVWLAEQIVERYYPRLSSDDTILEPSCGPGRFLQVIPPEINAFGVEIDAALAAEARERTGRQVICGDFRTVRIDREPTLILGNPPFQLALIDEFLDRCYSLLPEGGQIGWILPVYMFQTAGRVVGYQRRWSISQELIPRNVYPGLKLPLLFASFRKDNAQQLFGFAFYQETDEVLQLEKGARDVLSRGRGSAWLSVVLNALNDAGGRASLETIYKLVEGRRPTQTNWWREQIRKVVRISPEIRAMGDGWYESVAMA